MHDETQLLWLQTAIIHPIYTGLEVKGYKVIYCMYICLYVSCVAYVDLEIEVCTQISILEVVGDLVCI